MHPAVLTLPPQADPTVRGRPIHPRKERRRGHRHPGLRRTLHRCPHQRAPGLELALLRPLLTLLATGEPVTVNQLATEAGRPAEEIRQALAAMPDTEYDTEGRATGYGLTLNPTPHRYETDGRTLYTWCALDMLIFPAVLGHTAQVTSPCRATGEPVHLTVTPDGPTDVEPDTAVVSLVPCEAPVSIRTSFCNEIHSFTSAESAEDWLAGHPGSRVMPVADAYAIEQPLVQQILTGTSPSGCCWAPPGVADQRPPQGRADRKEIALKTTTDLLTYAAIAPVAGYAATKVMEPVSMKLYQLEADETRRREDAARRGSPSQIAADKTLDYSAST